MVKHGRGWAAGGRKGAILAQKELNNNVDLVLIGDEKAILSIFKEKGVDIALFSIVDAPDVIEMGDHPTKAFAKKPNSNYKH